MSEHFLLSLPESVIMIILESAFMKSNRRRVVFLKAIVYLANAGKKVSLSYRRIRNLSLCQ